MGRLQSVIGFLLTVRVFTSSVVGSIVFGAALVSGRTVTEALLAGAPFTLACMAGFALNDYFDATKDTVNRPYRAIPSGRLSRRAVLIVAALAAVGAIVLSCLQQISPAGKIIYLSACLGVLLYNVVVKYFGFAKTGYTGMLSALPFAFCVFHYHYATYYWLFPLAVTTFVMGRELAMDIHDIEGDAKDGVYTAPMMWGVDSVRRWSMICQFVGSLLLLLLAVFRNSVLAIVLAFLVVCLTAVVVILRMISKECLAISIYTSWIPMLAAVPLLYI